jgi:hypothetical protein
LSYGPDHKFTINEFEELTQLLSELRSNNARVIWGRTEDKSLENRIKLAVIVTNYAVDESKTITNIGTGSVSKLGDTEIKTTPLIEKAPETSIFNEPISDDIIISFGNTPIDLDLEFTPIPETKPYQKEEDPFGFLTNQTTQSNSDSQKQVSEPQYEAPQSVQSPRIIYEPGNPPSNPHHNNPQNMRHESFGPDVGTIAFDFKSKAPQKVKGNTDPRFENDITFNELYNTPAVQRLRNDNLTEFAENKAYNAYPFSFEDDMPNFLKEIPD